MANGGEVQVKLTLIGDSSNLQQALSRIQQQIAQINGATGGVGSGFQTATGHADTFQQSLRGLIGRFSALWAVMKSGEGIAGVFNVGVQFNAAMQDARLGMGALITAQAKVKDGNGNLLSGQEALNAAMAMGDDQIQKLRISGLQTAATTEQLVSAYQDAVGGGLRAGMSLDQIRQLTVQTVQAAGAMGVPMNQLNQEIRSILDGTIDRNSRVAIRLGITNADVAKWKEAGTLFAELNKRMDAFAVAGKESMNNWTTMLSNMKEAGQILLGDAFKTPMKDIQAALASVMESIINIDTAQIADGAKPVVTMLRDLGRVLGDFAVATIKAISNTIMSMGQWWERNRDAITGFISGFETLMGNILSFVGGVAGTLIKWFADFFLWVSELPGPMRAATVAMTAFTISLVVLTQTATVSGLSTMLAGIVEGIKTFVLAIRVAMIDMAGFRIALTALGGPVAWIIAAVAALGAGIFYLASQEEAAAEASLKHTQQYTDQLTALRQLLPTLKEYDAIESSKLQTQEAVDAYGDRRKQLITDLIKLAPSQREAIEKEAEGTKKLADIAKEALAAESGLLAVKIAKAEVALREANIDYANSVWRFGKQDKIDKMTEELNLLKKTREEIAKTLTVEKLAASLTPNKADDAAKLKKIEQDRAREAQLALMIRAAEIDAMPRLTEEQRKQWEIEKSKLELEREIERIIHMEGSAYKRNQLVDAAIAAQKREQTNIEEVSQDRKQKKLEAYYNFLARQEGDALQRKLEAIEQEAQKLAKEAGVRLDRQALQERFDRETIAFRRQEVEKLKGALRDLEEEKGRALTFTEQQDALQGLADKLKLSAEAVGMLRLELTKVHERQGDWVGGIKAGLMDVAETVRNRFSLMRESVVTMARGMQSALSNAIAGMLSGTMTFSKALKALWKGIVDTVIQAVAEMIAKFIVAAIVNKILGNMAAATAPQLIELAVANTWAAYAGIPFVGLPMALAQIAAIMGTYGAAKALSIGSAGATAANGASLAEGGEDTGSATWTGAAVGGLFSTPTATIFGEAGPELVAPESTFLDWIKGVANPIMGIPSGGFSRGSESAFAGAGAGGQTTVIQASFDGAMILGDSAEGLRKAASALRTIRDYDNRVNG